MEMRPSEERIMFERHIMRFIQDTAPQVQKFAEEHREFFCRLDAFGRRHKDTMDLWRDCGFSEEAERMETILHKFFAVYEDVQGYLEEYVARIKAWSKDRGEGDIVKREPVTSGESCDSTKKAIADEVKDRSKEAQQQIQELAEEYSEMYRNALEMWGRMHALEMRGWSHNPRLRCFLEDVDWMEQDLFDIPRRLRFLFDRI